MTSQTQVQQDTITIEFLQTNRISYVENSLKYTMALTKKSESTIYFGCVNRYGGTLTKPKCSATGIFNIQENTYIPKKSHCEGCGSKTDNKIIVSETYEIQRDFLLNELSKNQRLTATAAVELIRKENQTRPPEQKLNPLNYEQVKYIVKSYREENGVMNTESLNDKVILSKDNSIFLRYNSSYYSLYKSKIIYLLLSEFNR